VIRRALPGDAEAVAEIYNVAVRETVATFDTVPRSAEGQRALLRAADRGTPILVAQQDGGLIGWAALSRWSKKSGYDGTVEISVYIRQACQGQGHGQRLAGEILRLGREAGLRTVLARIESKNAASIHIFGKLGFQNIGTLRQVGYKFGRNLDVTLMQLIYNKPS
jgi:phosphinothricin acetyltransferase